MNSKARITIELSGRTLEKLMTLSVEFHRHPDDLIVDLLNVAIEASAQDTEASAALMMQSYGGPLQ
jgi:hypothetical protein